MLREARPATAGKDIPVTRPSYGPFSDLEVSFIREAAAERGITVSELIRKAVLDDLFR